MSDTEESGHGPESFEPRTGTGPAPQPMSSRNIPTDNNYIHTVEYNGIIPNPPAVVNSRKPGQRHRGVARPPDGEKPILCALLLLAAGGGETRELRDWQVARTPFLTLSSGAPCGIYSG